MQLYECNKCNKKFTDKSNWTKHRYRKTPCDTQIANANNMCDNCNVEFSSATSLHRHVTKNTCYKKQANQIPKRIKELVWNECVGKDKGTALCSCCGITEISQMNFHCGHCVSDANGGDMEVDNMRPICPGCNSSMGSMNMDVFIKKFKLNSKMQKPISNSFLKLNIRKLINEIHVDNSSHKTNTDIIYGRSCTNAGKVKYTCHRCDTIFNRKDAYDKHMNRKNSCDAQIGFKNANTNECNKCKKEFKSYNGLYMHHKRNTCVIKTNYVDSTIINTEFLDCTKYVKLSNKPIQQNIKLTTVVNLIKELDNAEIDKLCCVLVNLKRS